MNVMDMDSPELLFYTPRTGKRRVFYDNLHNICIISFARRFLLPHNVIRNHTDILLSNTRFYLTPITQKNGPNV